jgi:hypothetical protein
MKNTVMHVDDRYEQNSNSFPKLREFFEDRGFTFVGVAKFDSTESAYRANRFPEVVILDILDRASNGKYTAPGVKIGSGLETHFEASPQAPCVIYYTGIRNDDHPAIREIRKHDPYAIIVRKSARVIEDAEMIYSHFPESLKKSV